MTAALGSAVVALLLMGRPVVHDVSLAQLQGASEYVLEVEQATPFTASRENAEGCEEKLWRVVVKGVLTVRKNAPKPPAVESTIEVVINRDEFFDCMAHQQNSSGESYRADRYTPSSAEPGKRFLVFVRGAPRGFVMAAQRAWEVVEKKSALAR